MGPRDEEPLHGPENGRLVLKDPRLLNDGLDEFGFPAFSFENELVLDRNGSFVPNSAVRDATHVLFSGSLGYLYSCLYCSNSQLRAMCRGKETYTRKRSVSALVSAALACRRLFQKAT